jgi:hypothetical protein
MRVQALIDESLDPREAWVDDDRPSALRPGARLARLRLAAARGDVDVDEVADAIVRRLQFTAAARRDLTGER